MIDEEKIKKLVEAHDKVLVLGRGSICCLYSKSGHESHYYLPSVARDFIKRFFPRADARANVFKVGEREEEILSALEEIKYRLESNLRELPLLQCEFMWLFASDLLPLLKKCMEDGVDPKTAAIVLALHDDKFGEDYMDAQKKANVVKNMLDYVAERKMPLTEKEEDIQKKDIHRQLAEQYGRIIELRKNSPSYHIYDGCGWTHVCIKFGAGRFFDEALKPVNTHMREKHRVYALSESEIRAVEALNKNADIGYIYEKEGFPGLAKEYSTLISMLRDPLSKPEHLDLLCYEGDILRKLTAEMAQTGKPLKEAADSLREKDADFAKEWEAVMQAFREKQRKLEPLLPYLGGYLKKEEQSETPCKNPKET